MKNKSINYERLALSVKDLYMGMFLVLESWMDISTMCLFFPLQWRSIPKLESKQGFYKFIYYRSNKTSRKENFLRWTFYNAIFLLESADNLIASGNLSEKFKIGRNLNANCVAVSGAGAWILGSSYFRALMLVTMLCFRWTTLFTKATAVRVTNVYCQTCVGTPQSLTLVMRPSWKKLKNDSLWCAFTFPLPIGLTNRRNPESP